VRPNNGRGGSDGFLKEYAPIADGYMIVVSEPLYVSAAGETTAPEPGRVALSEHVAYTRTSALTALNRLMMLLREGCVSTGHQGSARRLAFWKQFCCGYLAVAGRIDREMAAKQANSILQSPFFRARRRTTHYGKAAIGFSRFDIPRRRALESRQNGRAEKVYREPDRYPQATVGHCSGLRDALSRQAKRRSAKSAEISKSVGGRGHQRFRATNKQLKHEPTRMAKSFKEKRSQRRLRDRENQLKLQSYPTGTALSSQSGRHGKMLGVSPGLSCNGALNFQPT
jgi:hypothetical protein